MSNYLEELSAEFYEYKGCFIRRNVKVNKRNEGGHEGELDVIAYSPKENIIYHIESTMDAGSWAKREHRYKKKFASGHSAIPEMFPDMCDENTEIKQIVLLGYGSNVNNKTLAGGKVIPVKDFFAEIITYLRDKDIYKEAVPENYPLLRTIQFMISKGFVKQDVISISQSGAGA